MKRQILSALTLLMAANSTLIWGADEIASLEELEGTVLVDQGVDFVTGEPQMPLEREDSVLTREASSALIVFEDGCDIRLPANKRIGLEPAAMCCIDIEDDEPIATLEDIDNIVQVSRSEQEIPIQEGMDLFVADIVTAKADSSALIAYKEGCDIRVENESQVTLGFAEECCLGVAFVSHGGAIGTGAPTSVSTTTTASTTTTGVTTTTGTGISTEGLIAGGVVGGGILAIIIGNNDDDQTPISGE